MPNKQIKCFETLYLRNNKKDTNLLIFQVYIHLFNA